MALLDRPDVIIFKPFQYEWAYDAWLVQQRMHWLPEDVSLGDDVKDWKAVLTNEERYLLTQIFRFFTQADIEVNNCYMRHYAAVFFAPEVAMMLAAFSNIETIHMAAYAYLLDTVGMPEIEYRAFLDYKEMRDKYDYMQQYEVGNKEDKRHIALTLAVVGAFTEGLQLFASFAMLLSFQRFGKMKGMCQVVAYSIRDESLHADSMITLFKTFIQEYPEVWDQKMIDDIYAACIHVVKMEDRFIKLAFGMGEMQGLVASDLELYIRYIANIRLTQLGLEPIYSVTEHPLPWLHEFLNTIEYVNFFENRVTEYTRAGTEGAWEDVWEDEDKRTLA